MKRMLMDILDGLRFQPGRTLLSILAVSVGMTALTILIAVMGGLKDKSQALIEEMGANVFIIMPGKQTEVFDAQLDLAKRNILQANLPDTTVAAVRQFKIPLSGLRSRVKLFAADSRYFKIHDWSLLSGRLLDDIDHHKATRVALATRALAAKSGCQPGRIVYIGTQPFTIIGIVERPGSSNESETSDASIFPNNSTLFIPLSCSTHLMKGHAIRSGSVDILEVKVHEAKQLQKTVETARRILSARSGIDTFTWVTPDSILENIHRLERIVALTAGSVAFLCLVLGGTTLMSLMVANVRDRILEIALRRTLGATQKDIAALFVTEACFVTALASLLGITVGVILLLMSNEQTPIPINVNAGTLLSPLLVAIILGVIFSYLPVRMATSITPAEALRND